MIRIGRRRSSITTFIAAITTIVCLIAPGGASAALIPDVPVTPIRTPQASFMSFTGLLPAPTDGTFFTPPTPLPGRPGDVIWAQLSSTPATDILGTFSGATTATPAPNIPGPWPQRKVEVWKVMYHTTNRAGESRAAMAMVLVDRARAAGSKLIVSMHGWTGFGENCGVFGNTLLSGALAQASLLLNYIADGYTVVIPDGPGVGVPGRTTTMVSGDATRSILDAAYAGYLFAGTATDVMVQGHSLGGQMVYGVGGDAPTYVPQLKVRGIIALAPAGMSGPRAALFDPNRVQTSSSSVDVSNAIAYVMQLEAAFGSKAIPLAKYLTPRGLALAKKFDSMCNTDMQGAASLYSYKDVIKSNVQSPDPGSISRASATPTLMVISTEDIVADPLYQYQTYVSMCAAGQPTYWMEYSGNHGSVTNQALTDAAVYKPWFRSVAAGSTPPGACVPITPTVSRFFLYTSAYVANALGVVLPEMSTVTLAATGSCRVVKGVLEPGTSGTCDVQIRVTLGKKVVSTTAVTLRVRET